jgi:hypothetical protein
MMHGQRNVKLYEYITQFVIMDHIQPNN